MNASQLKEKVENTGSYFFSRGAMQFFGDTMRNYGVRTAVIETRERDNVVCWELWRKRPVKHGTQSSAYFDKETYKRVYKK